MWKITIQFSLNFFDIGFHLPEYPEPKCFYHGFVLVLMVEPTDRYYITSNRKSGFDKYDIILEAYAALEAKGFDASRICKCGFAFEGKKVLIE